MFAPGESRYQLLSASFTTSSGVTPSMLSGSRVPRRAVPMKPIPICEVATIVMHSSASYMRSGGENGELDCGPVGIVKGKERTNDAGSGESYMSYWR